MNYLLSIIIPTKDRYDTLFPLISALIDFHSDEMEIVVQDNSNNNAQAVVFFSSIKIPNVKYFYHKENLSVIENTDLAVLNSLGEYVCFIGDDDGVMPYITKVVEWMKRHNYEILKSIKPNYYWPNMKINYFSKEDTGVLYEPKYNYKTKEVSNEWALYNTLSKGGTTIKQMPCLYHGIVKRELLNKIHNQCSTFFPGPSPDMANAIALSLLSNKYVYVDFPVLISGKNINSAGGKGILHQHIARIEDVFHLPKNTSLEWDDRIPKYWTGQTIWGESVLISLKKLNKNSLISKFRFSYLYASIYLFNYRYRKEIFKNFQYSYLSINFIFDFVIIFFIRLAFFIDNRINFKQIKKTNNIKSIKKAITILYNNVDKKVLDHILNN